MKIRLGNYPKKENQKRIEEIKIDKWDTIDCSGTIALIMVPLLQHFKVDRKTIGGFPCSLTMEIYNKKLVENDEEYEVIEKKWNDILDHMIWSFEQISLGCPKEEEFVTPNGYDEEGYKEYIKVIHEGLYLFAKYFRDLWW